MNQISIKHIFIQRNAIQNVWKMTDISSRPESNKWDFAYLMNFSIQTINSRKTNVTLIDRIKFATKQSRY